MTSSIGSGRCERDHLDVEDLLRLTGLLQAGPVSDVGLLEAASARPQARILGDEAYPTLELKAAATLHSLVGNHALVDGNRRLAWLAAVVFLDLDGHMVDPDDDAAFVLVMAAAEGHLDVEQMGQRLRTRPSSPRRRFMSSGSLPCSCMRPHALQSTKRTSPATSSAWRGCRRRR